MGEFARKPFFINGSLLHLPGHGDGGGVRPIPPLVSEVSDTTLENFPSHVVVFVEPIQDDDKPNLKMEGRNDDVFLTTGFRPASITQRFCNEKYLIAPEQNRLRNDLHKVEG